MRQHKWVKLHIMKRLFVLNIIFIVFIIAGCASSSSQSVDTENIHALENVTQQQLNASRITVGKIRQEALKDTAMSLGAQAGLAYRSKQIDQMLQENEDYLAKVFNFDGLMLDHNVLPPVLEVSDESLDVSEPNIIRLSDHTYHILQEARFVTAPPTWEDYLWLDYKKPDMADATLLPKDEQEQKLWRQYINIGWQNGIDQANNIYSDSLAKLTRDYRGMMLYRKLLADHMVSKPFVAKANMGITSNSDNTEMRINDRILRITSVPKLQPDSKEWKPTLIHQQ